jgi:hypothetical protein
MYRVLSPGHHYSAFRTDKAREIALFHVLGKLPEPEVIHGFV